MHNSIAARFVAHPSGLSRLLRRRLGARWVWTVALGVAQLIALPLATAASPNVVISQIYGAGGNTGATYKNDYVELFNRSSVAVSLDNWSVQYTSATGTGNFSSNVVSLSGSIQGGSYYLVQLAGGSNGSPLPTADASGSVNLSATGGKVIVANVSTGLDCNGSTVACTGANAAAIVDLVGQGTANYYEGSGPAPAPSTTTADFRSNGGCTDTDDNAADFTTAAPNPRNSSTTAITCGSGSTTPTLSINSVAQNEGNSGTTPFVFTVTLSAAPTLMVTVHYATADGSATAPSDYSASSGTLTFAANTTTLTQTITVLVNGDTTPEPDETFSVNLSAATNATIAVAAGTGTIKNDDFASDTIMQIQGHGAASPLVGQTVSVTPASGGLDVVTAVDSNGFFVQDTQGDDDPTTSDAVFVYTGSAPGVSVGDAVTVTGTVAEYSGSTEITAPTVTVLSHANALPAAIDIGTSSSDPTSGICSGGASTINPQTDGYQASNFACLDGMLVTMAHAVVNAPTFGSGGSGIKADSVGGFYVRPASIVRVFRQPGLQFPAALNALPSGYDASTYAGPIYDGDPEVVEVYLPGLLASTDIAALPDGGIYNAGAELSVTGIVQGYQASGTTFPIYEIYPRPAAQTTSPDLTLNAEAPTYPVAVPASTLGTLTVGSQNMLHFFNSSADGADTSAYNDTCAGTGSGDTCPTAAQYAARLQKMSLQIRTVLRAPAIQVVQEAENYAVMKDLAAQISGDDASVVYHPYLLAGNDPGGINIGIFTSADVSVNSVTQLYKGTTTSACSSGSSCLLNDRPPVLLDATFNGSYRVRVLAIYDRSLLSLGSNDYVGKKRRQEAEQVACIVRALQITGANVDCDANTPGAAAGDAQQDASGNVTSGTFNVVGDANLPLVVVGDFNAYQFSDGYVDVTGTIMGTVDTDPTHSVYPPTATYVAPTPTLFDTGSAANPADHYSYTYGGYAQEIDHVLLNSIGHQDFVQIGNAHGNADVSSSSSDATITTVGAASAQTARRSSDHDGQVVTLGYVVTPTASNGGSISPSTLQTVSSATPVTFTLTPDAGYDVSATDTCGSAGSSAGSFDTTTHVYTIPAGLSSNCAVSVTFNLPAYAVTTTISGTGGSISAPAQSPVTQGASTTFTVDPLPGYAITSVTGDTCTPSVQSGDLWNSGAISAACTITAVFAANAVDGACGSDNGQTLSSAPSNLCASGTPSAVAGSGPWSWSCQGSNGGSTATCSANATPGSIAVVGIGNGDSSPSSADGTDFGNVQVGAQATHGFTITNAGDRQPVELARAIGAAQRRGLSGAATSAPSAVGDLVVTGITSSNPAFTVSGGTGTIASGGSTTFNVTFHASSVGPQNATITVHSNDPTSPSYSFAVTAAAVAAATSGSTTAAAPTLSIAMLYMLVAIMTCLGSLAFRRRSER